MKDIIKRTFMLSVATLLTVSIVNIGNATQALVPGSNEIVSKTSNGNKAHANQPIVSANGKVVVFYSGSSDMLPSGGRGIFTRDIESGAVNRVNMSTAGVVSDTNDIYSLKPQNISSTGRYVLFESTATNLIDGRTTPTGSSQLYLRDSSAATTTLVSQTIGGVLSNGTFHKSLGVSSDGRFIAFTTDASNLHIDSSDGKPHVYMLDRIDNTLLIIDRKTDGTVGTTNATFPPFGSMSCDGSILVFQYPSSLVVGESTYGVGINILDRRGSTDKITNIMKNANSGGLGATISCNGDYIGFKSGANNLDSTAPMGGLYSTYYKPYIYDRVNNKYYLASISNTGVATPSSVATCGLSQQYNLDPCIQVSDNGIGFFWGNDVNLTGATGQQLYIHNINNRVTELITRDIAGAQGNMGGMIGNITADGRSVVYSSYSSNLVSGDNANSLEAYKSLTGI